MHFVATIGQRYLWADSLCLVQDNPEDFNRGIQLMGLIYEGALLTIIAANGSSADAGLPRIHGDPNRNLSPQRSEEIMPGLRFAIVRAVDCYLRASVWASRGWTYQEEIFSHRSIIFVNDQVYYRCRQRIWAEDTWADLKPTEQDLDEWSVSWVALIQDVAFHQIVHPLDQLFDLIEGFQLRSLTRDSDAINAVSGILQPLSKRMRTPLLEGLPSCAFDLALLFSHLHPIGQHSPGRRRCEFPSWSWAGWVGNTHWNAFHELYNSHDVAGINDWLDNRTWIVWYKIQQGQLVKIVRYAEPVASWERVTRDIMYERRSPLPTSGRFPKLRTSRTEPSSFFVKKVSYTLLAFYTVSIILTTSSYVPGTFLEARNLHLDALFDNENGFCGFLSPDVRHSAIEHRRVELIILSECQTSSFPPLDRKGMEDRIHPIWSKPYQASDSTEWQLYWVLAIAWSGDCYERRGLGQILQSAVDKSLKPGPQWKEIVLG
ncbi:uncharacterized protein A1O5_12253 [Cladophialophora psammophila CBS 110553]|uniref:Heterokaryon incompatibility domain-containing protein n=1 Tax=Cladophialophora psammophila CBS 110553 TaxID=1182543 RepID=W9VUI8_9EURO|nr:uncharacterized protein A1O5_12253 [Cladophialophora psammophila CBS 110553]EXJ59372.1 hypothetical protein A1O5_12253 [Cladophialophora psammophila CBS 110553]